MNEININKPSRAQIKKLISGKSIIVKSGEYPIHVNAIMFKKMNKNFMKGKGCGMKMCHDEMKHNIKGGSVIGDYFNNVGHTLLQATKPYISELATGAILSGATALSAFQPELAPFIIPASLGLSAIANQYINDYGEPKTLEPIPESPPTQTPQYQQPYQQYQQPYQQPYIYPQGQLAYSQMHSVPNMTGYGLYNLKGRHSNHGIMSGGNLLNNGMLHPAIQSPNPNFLLNRNLRDGLYK